MLVTDRDYCPEGTSSVPDPLIQRLWVIYKGTIPADRFFRTRDMYSALKASAHTKKVRFDEEQAEAAEDPTFRHLAERFGPREAHDAALLEKRMFEDAKKRGILVRASKEEHVLHYGVADGLNQPTFDQPLCTLAGG